jgi:hypothetical protein
VLLCQQQHITVILYQPVGLGAVLIIGDDCSFMGRQVFWLCPEEVEDSTIPECDLADCRGEVQLYYSEYVEGVEEYFLLVLVGLVGQAVSVDLHEAVIIHHLFLCLCVALYYDLNEI